jgi:hypothetical protein
MFHHSHSSRRVSLHQYAQIKESDSQIADTQNPGFFQGASDVNAGYSNFIEVPGNHNNIQNIHNVHNNTTDPEIEVS